MQCPWPGLEPGPLDPEMSTLTMGPKIFFVFTSLRRIILMLKFVCHVIEKWAISELPFASVSKQVLVQKLSYENEFELHENEHLGENTFSYEWFRMETCLDTR